MKIFASLLALSFVLPALIRADEPLPQRRTQMVFSANKRFYAEMHARLKKTTVYEIVPKTEPVKRWSMPGWYRVAHLADDGDHFVTAYDGVNLLQPKDRKPETIMLSFYNRGQLIRQVPLSEIMPDLSQLRKTESHYAWGHVNGFNPAGSYSLETVDGRTILYDPTTGQPLSIKKQ